MSGIVVPVDGLAERISPPVNGSERESLRGHLDFHRATLLAKCAGLATEQLRTKSSPPSALSLLGLVRHMAEVERAWFRRTFAGEDVGLVRSAEGDFQVAYDADRADAGEAFAAWQAEVAHARRIEAAAASLDETAWSPRWEAEVSLRAIMLHLIHDYARHNGHADLLREGVDGAVGV
ncbi:DinB family protein [Streptomyces albidoflavus]